VLLDNHPWDEMHALMAAHPWPDAPNVYDMRVFLVIKDAG
jgi:Family of unknown function (DUF6348)